MIIYLILLASFIYPSNLCSICSDPLPKIFHTDSWGNNFHKSHLKKSIFCNSCNRIISESITQGGYILPDSRYICNLCHQSSIFDKSQLNSIEIENLIFLDKLGLKINEKLNINLINQSALSDSLSRQGLHTSSFQAITKCYKNSCSIYILSHLPKLLFQSILMHEMVHVWFRINKINVDIRQEEGFCNLVSSHFLEKYQSKFSDVLLNNLYNNQDSTYGDGYRMMKKKLINKGWENIINDFKSRKKY